MTAIVASILLRLACCAALAWAGWRWNGPSGLVTTLPLLGIALARPLLDLASALRDAMNRAHWRDVEGRHYAFRGRRVQVIGDAGERRWVRLADVRALVGFTASDGALAITYRGGVRSLGRPAELHIVDEALLRHLAKERSPEALRVRRWVEREIVFPARRQRERLGPDIAATGPGSE
jgi:hypothetical protein